MIPPLTLGARVTTTDDFQVAVTELSVVAGRVATETVTRQPRPGSTSAPSTSTTTYTAWDSAGRPTAATMSTSPRSVYDLTYTYDDQARTRTLRQLLNGELVQEVTLTFDVNGQLVASKSNQPGVIVVERRYETVSNDRVCL